MRSKPPPAKRKPKKRPVIDHPELSLDRSKSINQIMGWPDKGEPDDRGLIGRVHTVCRKRLAELDSADLSLMFQQNMCVALLLPIAIERLEQYPVSNELYPPPLFCGVFGTPPEIWGEHPELRVRFDAIVARIQAWEDELPDPIARLLPARPQNRSPYRR